MVRSSKGRQKLEMVKIANESNLMVTFSKRRSGLFKKASEISTLCGAEVAIIVFSPGKKVFSFGHPSVEKVVERYVSGNIPQTSGAFHLIEAHRKARISELNMKLTQVHEFWLQFLVPSVCFHQKTKIFFLLINDSLGAKPTGDGKEKRWRAGQTEES